MSLVPCTSIQQTIYNVGLETLRIGNFNISLFLILFHFTKVDVSNKPRLWHAYEKEEKKEFHFTIKNTPHHGFIFLSPPSMESLRLTNLSISQMNPTAPCLYVRWLLPCLQSLRIHTELVLGRLNPPLITVQKNVILKCLASFSCASNGSLVDKRIA